MYKMFYQPEVSVVAVLSPVSGPPTMLTTWSNVDVIPPRSPLLASLIEPNSLDEPSVILDLSALVASSTDWLTILVSIVCNCPAAQSADHTLRQQGDVVLQSIARWFNTM